MIEAADGSPTEQILFARNGNARRKYYNQAALEGLICQ